MSAVRVRRIEHVEVLDSLSEQQVVRTLPSMHLGYSLASTVLHGEVAPENIYWSSVNYAPFPQLEGRPQYFIAHMIPGIYRSHWPGVTWSRNYGGPLDPFAFDATPDRGSRLLQSAWFPSVTRDLAAVMRHQSEGDAAAAPEFAAEAFSFLLMGALAETAPPLIAPLNDGGVQLEWHRGGLDVEVVFSPDDEERGLWVRDQATGDELETSIDPQAFRDRIAPRLQTRF